MVIEIQQTWNEQIWIYYS